MVKTINRMKEELFEEVKDAPYELPEGWKWVTLKNVAKIIMGQSPPSSTYNKEGVGIPFYQGKKEFGEVYLKESSIWCSEPKKLANPGDILISVRAPVGDVNITKNKCAIGRGLAIIRPKNLLSLFYVFYFLKYYKPFWEKKGKGSTFKAIKKTDLENLLIPLPFKDGKPDFEKQKQIVERIEALFKEIDKAIELRQKAIEETRKLFDSVLDRIFREAEKDKENWKWVRLEDIAEFGIGKTPKRSEKKYWEEGKYYWVSISDMQDKYITDTKEKVSQKAFDEVFKGKLIPKGTLLMSFKLTVGKTAILDISAFHNEAIVHIYPRDNIYRDFLYWILPTLDYSKYLNTAIKGKTLNKDILKKILIPLPFKNNQPDLEKQKQIANYLDHLHTKIKQLIQLQQCQLENFRKLKESILNKAFRGELM